MKHKLGFVLMDISLAPQNWCQSGREPAETPGIPFGAKTKLGRSSFLSFLSHFQAELRTQELIEGQSQELRVMYCMLWLLGVGGGGRAGGGGSVSDSVFGAFGASVVVLPASCWGRNFSQFRLSWE